MDQSRSKFQIPGTAPDQLDADNLIKSEFRGGPIKFARSLGWRWLLLMVVSGALLTFYFVEFKSSWPVILCLLMVAGIIASFAFRRTDGSTEALPISIPVSERESRSVSSKQSRERDSIDPMSSIEPVLWHAIVDAIPDAAVVLGRHQRVLRYNKGAAELFPNIGVGMPISSVSRNPTLTGAIDRTIRTSEGSVVQLNERLPVVRRLSVTVAKLFHDRDSHSAPELLICFRDHTEQDKLEQMRSDFIANASHELRTPLSSLRGLVDTLRGPARNDTEAQDRFLSVMSSQAERMTRLIDDLLSLSRVEMRAHLAPSGVVDLNEIVQEVFQALEPLSVASSIEIRLDKHDEPALVSGDREDIVQVVQNLVHNAIKYGRKNGQIDVSVKRIAPVRAFPEKFELCVKDDGIGIAEQHLPRLTERFYRANVASSREKGGTGLGLAIVKHIIARHRGELRIESVFGEGSSFTVSLKAKTHGK